MLRLETEARQELWRRVIAAIEQHGERVDELPVAPPLDPEAIRALLAPFDFETPCTPEEALDFAVDGLSRFQVHTTNRRYFGLFNPAPTTMGIAADALVAAWNPQLAAWSHSPFAIELEQHVIRALGRRFGWTDAVTSGTFASGGAEANHTAVLVALRSAFPQVGRRGVRSLPAQPTFYVSAEAHDSFAKAARISGLGDDGFREITVDRSLRLIPAELKRRIAEDREAGHSPFLVAATVGTTTAGAIDPLPEIAEICDHEGLWFHVDAAWGGAAVLAPSLAPALAGLERADSITFDAHKWLSVPMGAGVFLTRHKGALERTFRVAEGYMPSSGDLSVIDPYAHSIQWSRRFIGLKVFLSLAVAGWEGYRQAIERQTAMGDLLRERLRSNGWHLIPTTTPLPVVCFVLSDRPSDGKADAAELRAVAEHVVASGAAWINVVHLRGFGPALRACITHHETGPEDLDVLIDALGAARQAVQGDKTAP